MTNITRKVQGWREVDGDNTLALDWPIDENSIVVEIGGYEGRWALQMAEKYNPRLYVFEPQDWAVEKIKEKLEGYNALIYPFGLWVHDGQLPLGDFGRDGASLVKQYHQDRQNVRVEDIFGFFFQYLVDQELDVCLMNIEGGEFALLPYMIGLDLMKRIKYFWMQIHWFAFYAHPKMEILERKLAETHDIIWDYRPAAVCWKRKDLE